MGLGATGEDDARCRRGEYGEEEDFDKFQSRKVDSLREIISRIRDRSNKITKVPIAITTNDNV